MAEIVCCVCQKPFEPQRINSKACSSQCKKIRERAQSKASFERWYQNNRGERSNEKCRQWNANNRKRRNELTKIYKARNPEKRKATEKRYREINKSRMAAATAAWVKANHERAKARWKAWNKANPEKVTLTYLRTIGITNQEQQEDYKWLLETTRNLRKIRRLLIARGLRP